MKSVERLEVVSQATRYEQLAQQLGEQIRSGDLKPGDRLPSFPELKAKLRISQHTWEHAYALLEREGLVRREQGRGTFVNQPAAIPLTNVIGIGALIPMPWEHPYFSRLLQGIREGAGQNGYEILLLNDARAIATEKVDGLIGFENSTEGTPSMRLSLPYEVPFVSVFVAKENSTAIVADDRGGARLATEHLIKLGHERIAYLTTEGDSYSAARLAGYRDALLAAGITPNKQWVRPTLPSDQPGGADLGRLGMSAWLNDNWRDLGCTAILTPNDDAAIGAIRSLHEAGVSVPKSVSVIGFDDIDLSEHVVPSLTTISVPLREIGIAAVETLLAVIRGDSLTQEVYMVPTHLKIRESTAPPARVA